MNYHSTISIYWFDLYEKPHHAHPTALLKSGSMANAKRRAHQRATQFGLTPLDKKWDHFSENYATRSYLTGEGARRYVVVERS